MHSSLYRVHGHPSQWTSSYRSGPREVYTSSNTVVFRVAASWFNPRADGHGCLFVIDRSECDDARLKLISWLGSRKVSVVCVCVSVVVDKNGWSSVARPHVVSHRVTLEELVSPLKGEEASLCGRAGWRPGSSVP